MGCWASAGQSLPGAWGRGRDRFHLAPKDPGDMRRAGGRHSGSGDRSCERTQRAGHHVSHQARYTQQHSPGTHGVQCRPSDVPLGWLRGSPNLRERHRRIGPARQRRSGDRAPTPVGPIGAGPMCHAPCCSSPAAAGPPAGESRGSPWPTVDARVTLAAEPSLQFAG